jgi:hypothetical protein
MDVQHSAASLYVAGIIDKNGGLRVVVAHKSEFKSHLQKGEKIYILPEPRDTPVPWNEIYPTICSVEAYVTEKTAGPNKCGGCQQCCITPYINDGEGFVKPSQSRCGKCSSTGCRIYFMRPEPCRNFRCYWLKTQGTNHPMPAELRPDRCSVIFEGELMGELLNVHPSVDDPDAVHRNPVQAFINREQAAGRKARLVTHYHGEYEP